MADVDLELDIAHPTGLDGHVDDDLIDYDDDDVEIAGTTWKTHHIHDNDQTLLDEDDYMHMHGEDKLSHPSTQTMPDIPPSQTEDEIMMDQQATADSDTNMLASLPVEIPVGEHSTAVASPHSTEVQDVIDDLRHQKDDGGSIVNIALSEQQDVGKISEVDEIDYDDDEEGVGSALDASVTGQESLHLVNDEIPGNEAESSSQVEESRRDAHASDQDLAQNDSGKHDTAHEDATKGEDEHEITWEDDGVEVENSTMDKNPPEPVVHTLSDQANSTHSSHEVEDSEQVGDVQGPNLEPTEWEEEASAGGPNHRDATEAEGNVTIEHGQLEQTQSETHDDYAETQDNDYAELDVGPPSQHDDSHYPAVTVSYKGDEYPLASESPEAFFSDPSVQDLSIQELLAHFRNVLGEEITLTQELVFKVDELGLEFFETSPQDLIASNTMRGILDVFDVLVRNQDPDNSRSLYTYLYAKPNATKRLEFLTESAANGVGLDEISLLHDLSIAHDSSADHTVYDGEVHEEQEFVGEETNAQPDYDAGLGHGDDFENPADDHIESGRSLEHNTAEYDQPENDLVDDSGDVSTAGHIAAVVQESGQSDERASPEHGTTTVEDDAAFEDDKIDFSVDSTTAVAEHKPEDSNVDEVTTHTPDTVNPMHAAPEIEDELEFGLDAEEDTAPVRNHDDSLSEIDWRDASPPLDGAEEATYEEPQEEVPPTPSSATKRSRPEDEVDLDTHQDAKRLRF